MEREIFYIGARSIHSEKKKKDYYLIDYVNIKNEPQTDYVTIEEYNRISSKAKPYTKVKGIFEVNSFNKIYITDIKA